MSRIEEIEAAQNIDDLRESPLDHRETSSQFRDAGRQDRNGLEEDPDEHEVQKRSLPGRADNPQR